MSTFKNWTDADITAREARLRKPRVKESFTTEPTDAAPLGDEIKALHLPFKVWLDGHNLLYIYSRPDRPTGQEPGVADFSVFHLRRAVFVEFKAHPEPEKKLSKAQRDWRNKAIAAGMVYICTNSVQLGTMAVKEELELQL